MAGLFDNAARQMDDLFVSQFTQQDGFTVYQRVPYMLPWGGRGRAYIVSEAERDSMIAAFKARSGPIMGRMVRDIFIAMFSLMVTSQLMKLLFGPYANQAELALLALHLAAIVTIESKRLGEAWDAPLTMLAARAPAPDVMERGTVWLKPMERMRDIELLGGAAIGAIAGLNLISSLLQMEWPLANPVAFFGLGAICVLAAAIGLRCAVEIVRRLSRDGGEQR